MTTITRNYYPPSVRPAQIGGKQGAELFVTLGTRNCSRVKKDGGCAFCGLNLLDGQRPPLSASEAKGQMDAFFEQLPEGERSKIRKASPISMSDSLLNPKTIEPSALIEVAKSISEALPNVVEASIETRADMAGKQALEAAAAFFNELSTALKLPSLVGEIAIGIETASEEIRNRVGKGISDMRIEKLAADLAKLGMNIRGYFIYNLLERNDNFGALKRAVDFMARLRANTGVNPSILILRGYKPEGKQDTELFKGFANVSDNVALSELREAAIYAKEKGIKFEIDSTSDDQDATGAARLSQEYKSALGRYNCAFNPEELVIKQN